ncbi:MAG: ferritin family protein [Planctomycetota bacterium]|jgi:rubrerythrin
MGVNFNADEVFEMAEQIERNGARFYREAADKVTSREMKDMFLNMAVMEDGHLQTFQAMRKDLAAQEKAETAFDPFNEAALYLQTMADDKGSEGLKSPTEKLTGSESAQELLEIAIGAEKNSVLFYVGLKDLVSAKAGRDKVEAIIREEVRHVADLRRQLTALTT